MDKDPEFLTLFSSVLGSLRVSSELDSWFGGDFGLPLARSPNRRENVECLMKEVRECQKCGLAVHRTHPVFGEGSLRAELVFVGEAPGREEDLCGKPFVGKAGALLTRIIEAMGLSRSEVYITNILRCRPPQNRNPEPEEVASCRPYLIRLLQIIKPKVICTLGKFASQSLLGSTEPISRLRGRFKEFEGVPVMPTFHPAYLLRNPEDKKLVWQDMKLVLEHLGRNSSP